MIFLMVSIFLWCLPLLMFWSNSNYFFISVAVFEGTEVGKRPWRLRLRLLMFLLSIRMLWESLLAMACLTIA